MTHEYQCAICGNSTFCSRDTHVLGCSGGCYDEDEQKIEFCSIACFEELGKRWRERRKIAMEMHPEWFTR